MDISERTETLKKFDLFKELDKIQLNELAIVAEEKDFKKGEVLIEEGAVGFDVYLIYGGSVKIYRLSEDGKEVSLAVKGSGDIAGEMALFDHGVRTAYVEAIEDCKTYKIARSDFENILKNNPGMAIQLLRVLSKRISDNNQRLEAITTKSLKERVLSVLLTLQAYMPKINISQEQLASLVGATRPRVTEALSELRSEGKINITGHEMTVLQRTE